LQVLEEAGLLECDGQSIRCAHELMADAVIDRLTPGARHALHSQVALALERQFQTQSEAALLWDRAEHWRDAGDSPRAAELFESCAVHALKLGQPQQAAESFYQSALLERDENKRLEQLSRTVKAARLSSDEHLLLSAVHD